MHGNPNVHPSLRFGLRPDPAGLKVTPIHHLLGAPGPLPKTVDLSPSVLAGPGIMNQLQTSSCVGHATDGAIETRLAHIGQKIAHHSPICIYDGARCIDRVPDPEDGRLPPLLDQGSQPNEAMRAITLWGVCPYDDRPTDVATINDEPNLTELKDAAQFKLAGYYGINDVGSARLTRLMQALAAGYPVPFATFVDTGFEEWNPSKGPLGAPNANDPSGGGHYLYLCGYDTTIQSGVAIFKFANSWGTADWGLGGFGEANEDFIAQITNIYAMDVYQLKAAA